MVPSGIEQLFDHLRSQYTEEHRRTFESFKGALNRREVRAAEPNGASKTGRHVRMPPMFISAGAYVGDGTMVDSHPLVGNCAAKDPSGFRLGRPADPSFRSRVGRDRFHRVAHRPCAYEVSSNVMLTRTRLAVCSTPSRRRELDTTAPAQSVRFLEPAPRPAQRRTSSFRSSRLRDNPQCRL